MIASQPEDVQPACDGYQAFPLQSPSLPERHSLRLRHQEWSGGTCMQQLPAEPLPLQDGPCWHSLQRPAEQASR